MMHKFLITFAVIFISTSSVQADDINQSKSKILFDACMKDEKCKELVTIQPTESGKKRLILDIHAGKNCSIDWGLGMVCCSADLVQDPIQETCS